MPGKRIQLDPETWAALDLLARDRMMDFQELADEAFRDLLHKHGRPTDLKSALRESVRATTRAKPEPSKPEPSKSARHHRRAARGARLCERRVLVPALGAPVGDRA